MYDGLKQPSTQFIITYLSKTYLERIETENSEPRQRVAAEVAVVVAASLAVVENEWEACPALPWPQCWPWDSNPL